MERLKTRLLFLIRSLICIALILFDVIYIFSDYKPSSIAMQSNNINSMVVSAYNNRFNKYFSENAKSAELKSLINEINVVNAISDSDSYEGKISFKYYGIDENDDLYFKYDEKIELDSEILNISKFKIVSSGYYNNGYLSEITVVKLPDNRNIDIAVKNDDRFIYISYQNSVKNIDVNPAVKYSIGLIVLLLIYLIYNLVLFFGKEFKKGHLMVDIFINVAISIPSLLLFVVSIFGMFAGAYTLFLLLISLALLVIPIFFIKVKHQFKDLSYGDIIDLNKVKDYLFASMLNLVINLVIIEVVLRLYNM